jgi:HSP20 family protein
MTPLRKRRPFGFNFFDEPMMPDIEQLFASIEKEMMRDMEQFETMKKEKPGPNTRVYGFSLKIGPDGKPIFEEFGNVSPNQPLIMGKPQAKPTGKLETLKPKTDARVPFTDVIIDKGIIKVIAEMPGVKKEDIKLNMVGEDKIEIKVDTDGRHYYKVVNLEEEPDESTIEAKYNNGILELTMKSRSAKEKDEPKKAIKVR